MTNATAIRETHESATSLTEARAPIAVGRDLVTAIVDRRFDHLERLLHPEIRLRSMNASGPIERRSPSEVATFFDGEFGDATRFDVVSTSTRQLADRIQVSWQFDLERPDGDGPETVEQHLFIKVVQGTILRIDMVCSGFRPNA